MPPPPHSSCRPPQFVIPAKAGIPPIVIPAKAGIQRGGGEARPPPVLVRKHVPDSDPGCALQSTSMTALHRRNLPNCRPMADGGMRKCSAGACPPLGLGVGRGRIRRANSLYQATFPAFHTVACRHQPARAIGREIGGSRRIAPHSSFRRRPESRGEVRVVAMTPELSHQPTHPILIPSVCRHQPAWAIGRKKKM